MKVLIVCWYFPPTNTIAAVRLGQLAKFLVEQGHDIRVITAEDLPFQKTLPLGIPAECVTYTSWFDLNSFSRSLLVRLRAAFGWLASASRHEREFKSGQRTAAASGSLKGPQGLRAVFSSLYRHIISLPDSQIGWLPYAVHAGKSLTRVWRPDVVFASGPPFTTLLIGRWVGRRCGAPWIAELRDRWSDDPYDPPPAWRRALDRTLERWVLKSAAALVTVSEPWAATYRERYDKPTVVIYNGFDDDILRSTPKAPSCSEATLRILYTGRIYPGYRDPSPLFQAMSLLGADARRVCVEFYGTNPSHVMPLAEKYGIAEGVRVHSEVTHAEAVGLQCAADVLLLMQWNHPNEQGNVPGKLFEYLGVCRPILLLGPECGVPAAILREREAGTCANDPEAIVVQLHEWLETKRRSGRIPALPNAARAGFSRVEQYRKLEVFLERLLSPSVDASGREQPASLPDR